MSDYTVCVMSPELKEWRSTPRTDPPRPVYGGLVDAEMLHGGTVCVRGATLYAGCREVEALPGVIK